MGAEADATWIKARDGLEVAAGSFNAVLRDYGRLGVLLANDGAVGGNQIIPKDYLLEATDWHRHPEAFAPRRATAYFGYGYQFWTYPGESRRFALLGVYGQSIFVDPGLKLVMVITAAAKNASVGKETLASGTRRRLAGTGRQIRQLVGHDTGFGSRSRCREGRTAMAATQNSARADQGLAGQPGGRHAGAARAPREHGLRLLRQGRRRSRRRSPEGALSAAWGWRARRRPTPPMARRSRRPCATRPPTISGPIVLMGHRDTVFPQGEAQRRPFTIKDGMAYGPGVADMKAGLVMNAFVIEAFKRFGGHPGPLVALITSDEEIASPSSRPVIEAQARQSRCVFNSEPGRPSGNVVSGRKGGVFMQLDITGKAAHSGGNFEAGISAIEELARKTIAIHQLTDLAKGTTLNVGLVRGGQTVNTVAPWATAEIDLRYIKAPERDTAVAAIRRIAETAHVKGTTRHADHQGRIRAVGDDAGGSAAVLGLSGGIEGSWAST